MECRCFWAKRGLFTIHDSSSRLMRRLNLLRPNARPWGDDDPGCPGKSIAWGCLAPNKSALPTEIGTIFTRWTNNTTAAEDLRRKIISKTMKRILLSSLSTPKPNALKHQHSPSDAACPKATKRASRNTQNPTHRLRNTPKNTFSKNYLPPFGYAFYRASGCDSSPVTSSNSKSH